MEKIGVRSSLSFWGRVSVLTVVVVLVVVVSVVFVTSF